MFLILQSKMNLNKNKIIVMKNFFKISALVLAMILTNCKSDDDATPDAGVETVERADVVSNYANIVYQSYLDSYNGAVDLQTAVNTLVATPSEANLEAAKTAWLSARDIYGQTEAYRECNGPIDTSNESWSLDNEGQMNAWPMDEAYVDYISTVDPDTQAFAGSFTSIIADEVTYPTISENLIIELNEGVNDKSISTGWHAIEFLLWGQDNTLPSEDLAGQREFTDFATLEDADRRGDYLQAATDLLVSDLNDLVVTWNVGGAYRLVFEALDEDVALRQFVNGAFFIAGDELSSERMLVAVNNTDGVGGTGQEDEHSCFSDNTHNDVWANAQGVYNVVFGTYSTIEGASFYDLVLQENPTQAAVLQTSADTAMAAVNAVRNNDLPFDQLIGEESITNPGVVLEAVIALEALANQISASATAIGVSL